MKRLGVCFGVLMITFLCLFGAHHTSFAAIEQKDLKILQGFTSTFDEIYPLFGTEWSDMSTSVYERFKNDPDVDINQFKRYVLEGIPGATSSNQKGFIPMLNDLISKGEEGGTMAQLQGTTDPEFLSKARIALSQAQTILSATLINEAKIGGTLSAEEAQNATVSASQKGASATQAELAARSVKMDTEKCGILKLNLVSCADVFVSWFIKNTLLEIAGFLVWLSANMLNYSIQVSILDFNSWASESLYPVWIVIRQTVSLGIIFAGLYLGFLYIIGKDESFGRYTAWLVLFAIFVNFSYPVTRTLADISNVISLNVYSATVGSQALATDFSSSVAPWAQQNTAGAIIVNRLGLQDLAVGATAIPGSASSFVNGINSTPGALLAVIFVFYTAFVFFMATGIIAVRTVLLVLLIVASPLLFIDSVVPKLGDVSMKLRKLFFEQLVVAPVFMIMLALTLKFLDIFQTNKALSTNGSTLVQTGDATVQTFFTLLIMLIMLHVMLKVTKGIAGSAGTFATNFMGKVGGFGLGVASGGMGVLSRGTLGRVAAGARDSKWMDTMKDTKFGRGLSGAANFLANSTYDTRNIGMVSSGLSKAGITGGFGVSMQKSSVKGFDDKKKEREKDVVDFGKGIRDDATRNNYFANANSLRLVKVDKPTIDEAERDLKEKRFSQISTFLTADKDKQQSMLNQANISKDYVLSSKLEASKAYLGVPNNDPNAAQGKATQLKAMGIQTEEEVKALLKKDPFEDINKQADEEIRKLEEQARAIDRATDGGKTQFAAKQAEIGKVKNERDNKIRQLRTDTAAAFTSGTSAQPNQPSGPSSPSASASPTPTRPTPNGGSQSASTSTPAPQPVTATAPLVQTPEPISSPTEVTASDDAETIPVPGPRPGVLAAKQKLGDLNEPVRNRWQTGEQTQTTTPATAPREAEVIS